MARQERLHYTWNQEPIASAIIMWCLDRKINEDCEWKPRRERERESMCDEGDVDKVSSLLSRILVIDFSKCTKNYLFTIVI